VDKAALVRASLALLSGLGLQAGVVFAPEAVSPTVASALGLASAGLLVYGCAVVGERKGYSMWVGMAGLLSVVGVVVLVLLPAADALPRPWRRSAIPDPRPGPDTEPRKPST
jgi:hypothetical protein